MALSNTLFEALGPITWLTLRDAVGAPVDRKTAKAVTLTESHPIGDCVKMLGCKEHAYRWRKHSVAYRKAHRASHPLPKRAKVSA